LPYFVGSNMWNRILYGMALIFVFSSLTCRESAVFVPDEALSIGFYNLDNLFDDKDDTSHNDTEFTPGGKYAWTNDRYKQKLSNMEKVIHKLVDGDAPDVLGVCELESRKALHDLLQTGSLKNHYGMVHYDSPDERGIDVALVYNKAKLNVLESKSYKVKMSDNAKDATRDVLWVKAVSKKTNDTIQFMVCHFPSRREGQAKSEQDRIDAAKVCHAVIAEKCKLSTQNLVLMGDFNDEPWNKSISETLGAANKENNAEAGLFNLMWTFKGTGRGTYNYRNRWELLDQFMISRALSDGKGMEYAEQSVSIMAEPWMIQTGKYKGYPLRTFGGKQWLNGYSDHFPIHMKINLK
jgi:endonuclease/exonuclease/phosphatase family metal-dependent hydrolase